MKTPVKKRQKQLRPIRPCTLSDGTPSMTTTKPRAIHAVVNAAVHAMTTPSDVVGRPMRACEMRIHSALSSAPKNAQRTSEQRAYACATHGAWDSS